MFQPFCGPKTSSHLPLHVKKKTLFILKKQGALGLRLVLLGFFAISYAHWVGHLSFGFVRTAQILGPTEHPALWLETTSWPYERPSTKKTVPQEEEEFESTSPTKEVLQFPCHKLSARSTKIPQVRSQFS